MKLYLCTMGDAPAEEPGETPHATLSINIPSTYSSISVQHLLPLFEEVQNVTKNSEVLSANGGVSKLTELLESHAEEGLPVEKQKTGLLGGGDKQYEYRRNRFGRNRMPVPPADPIWRLVLESFNDIVVLMLLFLAFISLIIGLVEDPVNGAYEGLPIFIIVFVTSVITSLVEYRQDRLLRQLAKVGRNEETFANVLRGGQLQRVKAHDIVVGDVIMLQAGDTIPGDCLFLEGDSVQSKETELLAIIDSAVERNRNKSLEKKIAEENAKKAKEDEEARRKKYGKNAKKKEVNEIKAHSFTDIADTPVAKNATENPFLFSQCDIVAGHCLAIVIAVGKHTKWARTALNVDPPPIPLTPTQDKLNQMVSKVGQVGFAVALVVFIIQCINFTGPTLGETESRYFMNAFVTLVAIVAVAIPEGLPLAVTISLSFSANKIFKTGALMRRLAACETMGKVSTILTDKTGSLMEPTFTASGGWFADLYYSVSDGIPNGPRRFPKVLMDALIENISQNTGHTLLSYPSSLAPPAGKVEGGKNDRATMPRPEIIGDIVDGALLWMLTRNMNQEQDYYLKFRKEHGNPIKRFPFTPEQGRSAVLVKHEASGYRLYIKGGAELIVNQCAFYWNNNAVAEPMDSAKRAYFATQIIGRLGRASMSPIALAHCDVDSLPSDVSMLSEDWVYNQPGLVLEAIVGLAAPVRPDVIEAVKQCQAAGVMVRLVTGDNLDAAKTVARRCNILTDDENAMDAPTFRKLSVAQLDAKLPSLQVLARAKANDKRILTVRLNGKGLPKSKKAWCAEHNVGEDQWDQKASLLLPGYYDEWKNKNLRGGQVVATTGNRMGDNEAMKAADVSLAFGISGTNVTKKHSAMVIMNDRFPSILNAMHWGRCVNENIQSFLQFQLTVNAVALLLTLIAAVVNVPLPLNPMMLLWINLIMDTLAAVALGTEAPTPNLLELKPFLRNASLTDKLLKRNVIVQSLFQLFVLVILLFEGPNMFQTDDLSFISRGNHCSKLQTPAAGETVTTAPSTPVCEVWDYTHYTIIFNVFVFMQIFNEINARSVHTNSWRHTLTGFHRNLYFPGVLVFTILVQVAIIQFFSAYFKTTPLSVGHWIACVLLGAMSVPVGMLMRSVKVKKWKDSDVHFIQDSIASSTTQSKEAPVATGSSKYVLQKP